MSRRLHSLVVGLVPLLLWGATSQALEIAPTFQDRSVVGIAEVETDTAFRIEQAGDAAPDLNLFESLLMVEAELPVAFAAALADQLSVIDSDGGLGFGEVLAEIGGDAEDAFGFALGDSFFELDFVPDEDLRFRLEGTLEVVGDPDSDLTASVFLVDLDTGDELFGIGLDVDDACDTCEPVPFDFVAELEAGGSYSLSASATAIVPLDENDPVIPAGGGAAYEFMYTLLPIPEPSVAGLVCLGLLVLAAQRRPQPPLRSGGASNSTASAASVDASLVARRGAMLD